MQLRGQLPGRHLPSKETLQITLAPLPVLPSLEHSARSGAGIEADMFEFEQVAEAALRGIPFLTTDVGGVSELFDSKLYAESIVPDPTADALAKRMQV